VPEDAHGQHRPLASLDPAQAAEEAPLFLGQLYPIGDILAVIDDRAAAERARQALQDAGVPVGDVDLLDGAWFAQSMRQIQDRRSPLGRVVAWLSEEENITAQYVKEADQGHTIVVVHSEQPEVCGRVVRVLAQYGAHTLHHYGQLVITDL
jgi:hypothetical protein